MWFRLKQVTRVVAFTIALGWMSGAFAPAHACTDEAIGSNTGQHYTLISKSSVTETHTIQLSAGVCGFGSSETVTYTETYDVGYYRNDETGAIARTDCRTGKILGWM